MSSQWSSPDPVRAALDADEEFQVGLRAAMEFSVNQRVAEYERCMMKAVNALENEKLIVTEFDCGDSKMIDAIESDIQWKQSILNDLPLAPTGEQLKAIITLVSFRMDRQLKTASEIVQCCSSRFGDAPMTLTKKLTKKPLAIWEVFSPDHYAPVIEEQFFVLTNVAAKNMEKTMQYLQSQLPLIHHPHLKRIKNRNILICPTSFKFSKNDLEAKIFIELSNRNVFCESESVIEIVKVSSNPVLTQQQYKIANSLWPIRITVPLVDPEQVVVDEKNLIFNNFNKLFNSGKECLIIKDEIVVYATCADRTSCIHYKHAIINGCSLVGPQSDYLATGFDVYCLGEPCLMCSMALLHSRVSRVYYLVNSRDEKNCWGGLGSVLSIHANAQLNHRFHVFRVMIEG